MNFVRIITINIKNSEVFYLLVYNKTDQIHIFWLITSYCYPIHTMVFNKNIVRMDSFNYDTVLIVWGNKMLNNQDDAIYMG